VSVFVVIASKRLPLFGPGFTEWTSCPPPSSVCSNGGAFIDFSPGEEGCRFREAVLADMLGFLKVFEKPYRSSQMFTFTMLVQVTC
jgi:hypothetical protein